MSNYQPELVKRAEALIPLLREYAASNERGRVLRDEVVEALAEADLFRVTQPRRFGGHQADFRTLMEVLEQLGRGCGSTGWVATLVNSWHALMGTFPDRAQREFWEETPDARFCGVLRPAPGCDVKQVDGGIVITAKWPFASGSAHAQWAANGVPLGDDVGVAVMPMSELSIEDTWYVAGMCGTGSNTLVANEVFVPDHRIVRVSDLTSGRFMTEHTEEVLYRSPVVPHFGLVLIGPLVGIVRAALDHVDASVAKGKEIAYTSYVDARQASTVQLARAEAQKAFDIATLLVQRATSDVDAAARDGIHPSDSARIRVRSDVSTAVRHLRTAMHRLLDIGGAGSFASANPLQRMWRDLEVASRHGFLVLDVVQEAHGRALLGLDEEPLALR